MWRAGSQYGNWGLESGPQVAVQGLRALARPHLCVSSRAQDTVTALTFQAERMPVLAQGTHLLRCEGTGGGRAEGCRLQGTRLSHGAPPSPFLPPGDDGACPPRGVNAIPSSCQGPRWKGGQGCPFTSLSLPQRVSGSLAPPLFPPWARPHRRKQAAGNGDRSSSWLLRSLQPERPGLMDLDVPAPPGDSTPGLGSEPHWLHFRLLSSHWSAGLGGHWTSWSQSV